MANKQLWISNVNDRGLFHANSDIPGFGTKAIRAVALAQSGDQVLFPPSAKELFVAALRQRALMGRDTNIKFGQPRLCPLPIEWFYLGADTRQDATVSHQLVDHVLRLTSKNEFIQLAQTEGWVVPDTVCVRDGQADSSINALRHSVFKEAYSAGGVGVTVTTTPDEWTSAYQSLLNLGTPFQVQEYLAGAQYFGVQYFKGESVITTQSLYGTHYSGATILTDEGLADDIWSQAMPAMQHVADLGVPVFSLDVAVTTDHRVLLMECNPRYGASTYPWRLALELNLAPEQWEYRYVPIRSAVKADTIVSELIGLIYEPAESQYGLVVIDWGLDDNELGILFVGQEPDRQWLLEQVSSRLGE